MSRWSCPDICVGVCVVCVVCGVCGVCGVCVCGVWLCDCVGAFVCGGNGLWQLSINDCRLKVDDVWDFFFPNYTITHTHKKKQKKATNGN
jgi:hypothetical protein